MRWLFPEGKVDCVINSGAYSPTQTDFLNHVFQGGVAGRMNNPQAKDLSDCAAYLIYRVSTGTYPASNVSALMIDVAAKATSERSEEHTSELQSLMRISYAVFCLKKKNTKH